MYWDSSCSFQELLVGGSSGLKGPTTLYRGTWPCGLFLLFHLHSPSFRKECCRIREGIRGCSFTSFLGVCFLSIRFHFHPLHSFKKYFLITCYILFTNRFIEVLLTYNKLHKFKQFNVLTYVYTCETLTRMKIENMCITLKSFLVPFGILLSCPF